MDRTETLRRLIGTSDGQVLAEFLREHIYELDTLAGIPRSAPAEVVAIEVAARREAKDKLMSILADLITFSDHAPEKDAKDSYSV